MEFKPPYPTRQQFSADDCIGFKDDPDSDPGCDVANDIKEWTRCPLWCPAFAWKAPRPDKNHKP